MRLVFMIIVVFSLTGCEKNIREVVLPGRFVTLATVSR